MQKALILIIGLLAIAALALAGRFFSGGAEDTWLCQNGQWVRHGQPAGPPPDTGCAPEAVKPEVVLPVVGYSSRRTFKTYGEYIQDRFTGYHVGDDVEFADTKERIPVVAIAKGVVRKIDTVAGYGGVVVIEHKVAGEKINALYGHLDIAQSPLQAGLFVEAGDYIAPLGEDKSKATDGERKHLHFALYKGDELKLQAYEKDPAKLADWINPTDFFKEHNAGLADSSRAYNPAKDLGGNIFKIRFAIPAGMEVEYVPQIQALNIFTLSGRGTARERSQLFIRYFDAVDFQTLPNVIIHATEETRVGEGNLPAKRYEIEKKAGAADFPYQPPWRNLRHSVTDFKTGPRFARFYVFAKNPLLSENIYTAILRGIQVVSQN